MEYHEANVENFDLKKKDFTKAFVNETCGHWQEKAPAFKCIAAHLKDGAKAGFNIWLKGDKGSLNEAYDAVYEFRDLYKRQIWFQEDLATYEALLAGAGFKILEMYDCTDKLDVKMRARLKASRQWVLYGDMLGSGMRESGVRYYNGMLKTHYDFLRYGVVIAER